MSLMEGVADPLAEFKAKFVPTFIKSCYFWIPVQTINFLFVGPRFRVIYVGTSSLIWANILCFIKRQSVETMDEVKDINKTP